MDYFPVHIYGMSSFPLKESYFSIWLKPPTRLKMLPFCQAWLSQLAGLPIKNGDELAMLVITRWYILFLGVSLQIQEKTVVNNGEHISTSDGNQLTLTNMGRLGKLINID